MLRTVCLCTPHTVLRIRHPFLTLAAVSVFSKSVRPWRLFAGLAVGLPKHDRAFAMEEKASEGNVSYFSEYPSADLEPRLVKHRDEDGRSLLHTAAAAGTRARGGARGPGGARLAARSATSTASAQLT